MSIFVTGPEGETVILPSSASAAAQQSARSGGETSARAQTEKEEWYKREFKEHGRYPIGPQTPVRVHKPSSQYFREQAEKRQAVFREMRRKRAQREWLHGAATRVSPAAGEITKAILPVPVETEPSTAGGLLARLTRAISNILYPPQPEEQRAYGQFVTISLAVLVKVLAGLVVAAYATYAAKLVVETIEAEQAAELAQEEINETARAVKDSLVAEELDLEIASQAFEAEAKTEEDLKDLIRNTLREVATQEYVDTVVNGKITESPPPKKGFWQKILNKMQTYAMPIEVVGTAIFSIFIIEEFAQIRTFTRNMVQTEAEALLWTARNQVSAADKAMKRGDMEIAERTITNLEGTIETIEKYRAAHGEFADALDVEIVRLKTEHDRLQDQYSSMFEMYPVHGTVIKVNDGDTFVIESGESVRIKGIEAPERGFTGPAPYNYSWRECTDILVELIIDQDVNLEIDPGEPRDSYGRLLARVIRSDGLDVGEEMIALGAARRRG